MITIHWQRMACEKLYQQKTFFIWKFSFFLSFFLGSGEVFGEGNALLPIIPITRGVIKEYQNQNKPSEQSDSDPNPNQVNANAGSTESVYINLPKTQLLKPIRPELQPLPKIVDDRDHDGVKDKLDKCAVEYGDASNNGCPKTINQQSYSDCLGDEDENGSPLDNNNMLSFDWDLPSQKITLGKICNDKELADNRNKTMCSQYVKCADGTLRFTVCRCEIIKGNVNNNQRPQQVNYSGLERLPADEKKIDEIARSCVKDGIGTVGSGFDFEDNSQIKNTRLNKTYKIKSIPIGANPN